MNPVASYPLYSSQLTFVPEFPCLTCARSEVSCSNLKYTINVF